MKEIQTTHNKENIVATDEWYTPIEFIEKLGKFDVDPCVPLNMKWKTADIMYNKKEDGDMFHLDDTWVWKPPIPEHRYIMSIDCSRGDSDDRSALEIFDLDGTDKKSGLEGTWLYTKKYLDEIIGF